MIQEYVEYFSRLKSAINRFYSLTKTSLDLETDQTRKEYIVKIDNTLNECHERSKLNAHSFTDLILLPFQRISKYHLRFNDLLKETDREHSAVETIKHTALNMREICNYLNECQRDQDNIDMIEKLKNRLNLKSDETSESSLTFFKTIGRFIKGNKIMPFKRFFEFSDAFFYTFYFWAKKRY